MSEALLLYVNNTLILFAIVGVIILCLASIYDFMQAHKANRITSTMRRLTKSRQPHITVLVYIRDSADELGECLKLLRKSRYDRYDVVVVVDATTSVPVKRQVVACCKTASCIKLRVFIKRKPASMVAIIQTAYRQSQKGEIIAVINPSLNVTPSFLKSFAAEFSDDETLDLLYGVTGLRQPQNINGLATAFVQLSQHALLKLQPFTRKAVPAPHGIGSMYRSTSLGKLRGPKSRWSWRTVPLAATIDGSLRYENSLNSRQSLISTIIKQGSLVLTVLFGAWLIYMAATLQSVSTFLTAWLLVVIWLMAVTWLSRSVSVQTKLMLTLCLSFGYFLLIGLFIVNWLLKLARRPVKTLDVKWT